MAFNGYRLRCDLGLGDMVAQVLIWVLLSIVTFGLALFFLPYYMIRLPINRTSLIAEDGREVGRLQVDVAFGDILGHLLVWLLLTIVTFGLAYIVYWYFVFRKLMNAVQITPSP